MTAQISIIVPTRNRSALLARLIESLRHLIYPHWEVIVVDDGSSDDTAAVVEHFRRQGLPVTYLWQPWARMGAARNRGMQAAGGEILAFTDDDCVVDPLWLDAIARAFQAHPEALGVQGKTVTDRAAMTPFTRQVEQLEGGQPYRTCNIAYRADVLRALGGFDPLLIRGEDVLMGARVLERGPIVFVPDAIVSHPPRRKEWADRRAWRTLIESETHFKRTYARYAPQRSSTLSVQKPEHVLSRWVVLPIRRYWRWHLAYFRREPLDYMRHLPLIVREKLALAGLLPYFLREWARPSPPDPLSLPGRGGESDTSAAPPRPGRERGPGGEGRTEQIPLISVIIPTRNRSHRLPGLLAALGRQDYPSYEAIVVDDSSDDDTAQILRGWEGEGKRVLRLEQPGGSYRARNAGWREAQGEIVAFTDDDCLPSPEWLSGLARAFALGTWSGVQGVTLAEPGTATPFTHEIEQTQPGAPFRTCNIAYRRTVLAQQGGFDDRLRWYADNLFGLRVGLERIGFARDAVVFHPPRAREWRTRSDWLERFRADALYRDELLKLGNYSRAASSTVLPVILWILRPLLKQSWRHVSYLLRHPVGYIRGAGPMIREKLDLLRAFTAYMGERHVTPPAATPLPPLPAEPMVSVVIVTHNKIGDTRSQWLASTLAALDRQTWDRHEVVVVAHGYNGCALSFTSEYDKRIVTSAGTLAAARQAGVEAATGDIVAFTDDDCLPSPEWLARAVEVLQQASTPWGVQGRTLAEAGPPNTRAVRVERPDPLYQTCNIAYRRDALSLAGGFDLCFDGWFEDTALGARVSSRGEIAWEPEMVVTHRAVRRRFLDCATWLRLLADEHRLADRYPEFYHRVRGPSVMLVVVTRWLLGSPLKALWHAAPGAAQDPRGYLQLAGGLARERWALLAALRHAAAGVDPEMR